MMYHPDKLDKFCEMFKKEAYEYYTYKSGAKKGRVIKIPNHFNPSELGIYTPPKLTELGMQILGFY